MPLTPYQIGAILLTHKRPLATLTAAAKRAFPTAVIATAQVHEVPNFRTAVRDGADVLMTMQSGGRTLESATVAAVDLKSSRFQLAPSLYLGMPLTAAARVLDPMTT